MNIYNTKFTCKILLLIHLNQYFVVIQKHISIIDTLNFNQIFILEFSIHDNIFKLF